MRTSAMYFAERLLIGTCEILRRQPMDSELSDCRMLLTVSDNTEPTRCLPAGAKPCSCYYDKLAC